MSGAAADSSDVGAAGSPSVGLGAPIARRAGPAAPPDREKHVSLCEALDRLLHKGAVLKGEITISIANVDLVYLGFHMLLASIETARGIAQQTHPTPPPEEPEP